MLVAQLIEPAWGAVVEKGAVTSLRVRFNSSHGVELCAPPPAPTDNDATLCAGGVAEIWTDEGSPPRTCLNLTQIEVERSVVVLELGRSFVLDKYDRHVHAVLEPGIFCETPPPAPSTAPSVAPIASPTGTGAQPTSASTVSPTAPTTDPTALRPWHRQPSARVKWSFSTSPQPVIPPDAVTGNTSTTAKAVNVYGVGFFINDVAGIDLKAGTFYVDFQLFVLRYYRSFPDSASALAEATVPSSIHGNRPCAFNTGQNWLYLANLSLASIEDQKLLNFVNIGKFPKITVKSRASAAELLAGAGGQPKAAASFLDHFRVQSEFYFAAALKDYPFQRQTLPVHLEMASDVVQAEPSSLLCHLERFSGFAWQLSSFSPKFPTRTLAAHATVGEEYTAPPFGTTKSAPTCGEEDPAQFCYPRSDTTDAPLSHASSRVSWNMSFQRTYALGVLELAPPSFIGMSSLISYALPADDYKSRLSSCTTALVAAVVQHASLRGQLPPQSVLTRADVLMLVIYAIVFTAMLAAAVVAFVAHSNKLRKHTREVHAVTRFLGPCSVLLTLVLVFDEPNSARAWLVTLAVAVGTFATLVAGRWGASHAIRQHRRRRHRSASTHGGSSSGGGRGGGSGSGSGGGVREGWEPLPLRVEDWTVAHVHSWVKAHGGGGGGVGEGADPGDDLDAPLLALLSGPRGGRVGGGVGAAGVADEDWSETADLLAKEKVGGCALALLTAKDLAGLGVPFGVAAVLCDEVAGFVGDQAEGEAATDETLAAQFSVGAVGATLDGGVWAAGGVHSPGAPSELELADLTRSRPGPASPQPSQTAGHGFHSRPPQGTTTAAANAQAAAAAVDEGELVQLV